MSTDLLANMVWAKATVVKFVGRMGSLDISM